MNVIACIVVDLERSPLGLPARLERDLGGVPVLRRTIQRVLRCVHLKSVHVLVRPADRDRVTELLAGQNVRIETHDAAASPWGELVASARKWSLDAWRGGIAGMTVFDESLNPWLLEAVAKRENADAVIDIAPAAALIDPALLDAVIAHYLEKHDEIRLAFTQSPPGLSGVLLSRELLENLTQANQPLGRIMAYHPSEPQRDMVHQKCFHSAGSTIMYAQGRCLADSATAHDRMEAMFASLGEEQLDAKAIARWLADHEYEPSDLPGEVEIELTTRDDLPRTKLRPRGEAVGSRGPMDIALCTRLLDELSARDDVRVVLGGFGEPLLHPEWERVVEHARRAGIFGLAIRTSGLSLDDRVSTRLSELGVDLLNVTIDAHSAGTYVQLHGQDRYEELLARLDSVDRAHQVTQKPHPLLVPELAKTAATMDELEPFYDHWIERVGTAVISGPSHYAGQWPDWSVMQMAPPGRFPCRRIFSRAVVLADGQVTVCDQDYKGAHTLGSLGDTSLKELWRGEALTCIRAGHRDARVDVMPLCPNCDEWHRP